jgi:hypothetical protein
LLHDRYKANRYTIVINPTKKQMALPFAFLAITGSKAA